MARKDRLRAAGNFVLYYGANRESELSGFDLAVVEPQGQTPETVKTIQASGTLVLAYLSVSEVSPSSPVFSLLTEGDFLLAGGRPVLNQEYGNYLVDLRSALWRRLLLHQAGGFLLSSGYDGLFLDTIANAEMELPVSGGRDSQLLAAVNLVKDLRDLFPEHLLVQNNGLGDLCLLTAGLIDGLCWENPPVGGGETALVRKVVQRLKFLQENQGIRVMFLLEGKTVPDGQAQIARTIAREHRFLFYRAPADYTGDVAVPPGWEPDCRETD